MIKKLPDYHIPLIKNNALGELARNMHEDVSETQKRLKTCIDLYHHEKNQQEREQTTGSGASKRKVWVFFDTMISFLKDIQLERSVYTNVPWIDNPPPAKPSAEFDPLFHCISKFNTVVDNLSDASTAAIKSKTELSCNEETLVGMLMELKLNKMNQKISNRRINNIFALFNQCEDSESD